MGLGFGLLSAQLRPGERDWTRAYDETIELAATAERLGFGSIWTTEHHFVDDGYMPSLLAVSAAIGQVTERIEIGTGVLLAPLHHPLRLAEDAATASLLSHGRLTLGLGLGWSHIEYAALGVDMRLRGRALEEILTILPRAWTGEPFEHAGRVYRFPRLGVRPAPATRIPILIGGGAEPAVRRAARLADGVFANAPVDEFARQLDWIQDELDRNGRDPATFRVVHYSVMIPADSETEAWSVAEQHLWNMMWKYSDMEPSAVRPLPPPAPPRFTDDRRTALFGRATAIGRPEKLVEHLHAIRAASSISIDFVARSYFASMPYQQQVELMERLATDVAPHV